MMVVFALFLGVVLTISHELYRVAPTDGWQQSAILMAVGFTMGVYSSILIRWARKEALEDLNDVMKEFNGPDA